MYSPLRYYNQIKYPPHRLVRVKVANHSIQHKLDRVERQEQFRVDHEKEFRTLTEREKLLLELLANGYNNPQIATQLHINRKTVEQHRKNLNRKLNVRSLVDVFEYAQAFDLV